MHQARNLVIAVVASAVLVLGGSSYALWSAMGDLGHFEIRSGDLNLGVGEKQIWDISEDRNIRPDTLRMSVMNHQGNSVDTGRLLLDETDHSMSTNKQWRIVPGDELAILVPIDLTIVGDNLIARLDVNTVPPSSISSNVLDSLANYVTVSYHLYDNWNRPIKDVTPSGDNSYLKVYFKKPDPSKTTQETQDAPVVYVSAEPTSTHFTLCVLMTFDSVGDQELQGVGTMLVLEDTVQVSLSQVRDLTPTPTPTS